MAIQSTYTERMPVAFEGQVADETPYRIDSRICETAAGIDFGRAVSQGTADKQAVVGGALGAFVGVTVRDPTVKSDDPNKYVENDVMGVINQGDIWVKPSVAVTAGDPVHYNATTGVFTNTGGSGPIPGATYMTSAAADALAVIRLGGGMPT